MTDQVPPTTSAWEAVSRYIEAKSEADALRGQVNDLIPALDAEADRDVLWYLYWMDDFHSSLMVQVLGAGRENNIGKLLQPGPSVDCPGCGTPTPMGSRSQMRKWLSTPGRHGDAARCPACEARRQREHQDWNRIREQGWEQERESRRLRLEHLATMPYAEYLRTPEWAATRLSALKRARFHCQLCSAGGRLNVHHNTYERRGQEENADLLVLCGACHAKHHDKVVGE